jgi:hypothetical protein
LQKDRLFLQQQRLGLSGYGVLGIAAGKRSVFLQGRRRQQPEQTLPLDLLCTGGNPASFGTVYLLVKSG